MTRNPLLLQPSNGVLPRAQSESACRQCAVYLFPDRLPDPFAAGLARLIGQNGRASFHLTRGHPPPRVRGATGPPFH